MFKHYDNIQGVSEITYRTWIFEISIRNMGKVRNINNKKL